MVGNHPLRVGWKDEDFHAALPAGDAKGIGGIRIVIDRQPQPTEPLTNTPADLRVVLADPGGEDDTINAAERCGKRAELTGRAPDNKIDSLLGLRARLSRPGAHVAGYARPAKQAGRSEERRVGKDGV